MLHPLLTALSQHTRSGHPGYFKIIMHQVGRKRENIVHHVTHLGVSSYHIFRQYHCVQTLCLRYIQAGVQDIGELTSENCSTSVH